MNHHKVGHTTNQPESTQMQLQGSGKVWGKEVHVATKLEATPGSFWDHPVDNLCLFFREMAESMHLTKPQFPILDDYATNNEKLKAIGHYLNRCDELGMEPVLPQGLPQGLPQVDLDSEDPIQDPEILLAKLMLEYFHSDNNQGNNLMLNGGMVFINVFNAFIDDKLRHAEAESIAIRPSELDKFLLEHSDRPHHLSKAVLDVRNPQGLTPRMVFAMRLLAKDKKDLTENQKHFIANFLNMVPYNRQLNKALRSLTKKQIDLYKLDQKIVDDLARISFKTREPRVFNEAFAKLNMMMQLDKAGEIIPDNLRLTLHEIEVLDGHAKIADLFHKHSPYHDGENYAQDSKDNVEHIALCKKLAETKMFTEQLTKSVIQDLGIQSGDIIQNLGKKYMGMSGGDLGFLNRQFQNLRYSIAAYRHSGKVCFIGGKAHVSDMGGRYRNFPMDLANLLVSQFYRIHVDRLVPESAEAQLEEKYGENWREVVNHKYRQIEERIHGEGSKAKFGKIINLEKDQARVGVSYVLPFLHQARTSDRDYEKLHKKVMDGTYGRQAEHMVCSGFAAKTTIAALYQLNLELKEELDIEDSNTNIIDMPFGPREKLHYITPDRLTEILEERGCVDMVTSDECALTYSKYLVIDAKKGVDLPLIGEEFDQ